MHYKNTHHKLIDIIKYRLQKAHPNGFIQQEEEYKIGNMYGEIDLFMVEEDKKYAYAFEIKTTDMYHTRKKAMQQLRKDERFLRKLFQVNEVKKFYAYWEGGWPKIEYIKDNDL